MSNKNPKDFNYYLQKIAGHKVMSCIVIIALFFIPMLIVHILFKWNSNIEWLQAEWGAGDVISYIAGFEAFIGTAILSFLALWQNQQHKRESDENDKKLLAVENEKIRLSNLPQFLIETADYHKAVDPSKRIASTDKDIVVLDYAKTHGFFINTSGTYWIPPGKIPGIERSALTNFMSIINCGNNTAHQVKLSMTVDGTEYKDEKVFSIKKDDEIYLYIGLDSNITIQQELVLTIRFFDCFQNVYEQKFHLTNVPECVYLISYSDVELIKKNGSMQFVIHD